jgi:hypothetical protein
MARLTRGLLLAAVLLLVALNLSGCSLVQSAASINAFSKQLRFASAICSKAHAGSMGSDVPAGYAAKQLRAARIGPDPWSAMPRTKTIFWCFGNPQYPGGFFVDLSGLRTVAPPTTEGETCQRTPTSISCTSRLRLVTP